MSDKSETTDTDKSRQNNSSLRTFLKKRAEWQIWLDLDQNEPNSIQSQLFELFDSDLTYRILTQARFDSGAKTNQLLWLFIERGYITRQATAMRKLMDKGTNVISFPRLISEMNRYRSVMTRENYVCYDGTPYDPRSWDQAEDSENLKFDHGLFGDDAPALSKWLKAKVRHEKFDRLSGKIPATRGRDDQIHLSVFETLNLWLSECGAETFIMLANKFIAHAADSKSRAGFTAPAFNLDDVEKVHRAFVRVQRAIINDILFFEVWSEVVPRLPLGVFNDLDKPFLLTEAVPKIYIHWDELVEIRENWKVEFLEEIEAPSADLGSLDASTTLQLNNSHAKETSELDLARLTTLLDMAYYARGIDQGKTAFLIALDHTAPYENPNFAWFKSTYQSFVYIDRIIVAESARGQGIARLLYKDLFAAAHSAGVPRIVCEVNSEPPNPASDAFHLAMGFEKVGQAVLYNGAKTVNYFAKNLLPSIP